MKEEMEDKQKVTLWKALMNNFYMFGLAFKACPSRIFGGFFACGLGYGSDLFYTIIFIEYIFKAIDERTDFKEVMIFLVLSALFFCGCGFYYGYYKRVTFSIGNQKLYENLHIHMFERATDVELECYENPKFYNKYMKAVSQIKGKAYSVINVVSELFISIVSILCLGLKILSIDRFAIFFGIVPLLTTYLIGKKSNQVKYNLYHENIYNERQKEYVKRTIYQREYAKEIRLSNVFSMMMERFSNATDKVIHNTKQYGLKIGLLNCIMGCSNELLTTAGVVIYATVRLVYFKDIKISDYMVLVNTIGFFAYCLTNTSRILSKIQDNSLYIQDIKDFMEYKPKIAESQKGHHPDKGNSNLLMKDVSFTYFGQTEPVLKNINLTIGKGEKIALVGQNGAGKSTLVKLLMRLYDVTEGEICLNDINIKDYNLQEYRRLFGTVFQDFKVLSLTVAENVLMRDVKEEDRETVAQALKDSGVYDKVMSLPNGMDTTLTREFDENGVVLSGGEFQKIAIARVFARDCDIAILDEPSSALDPIAEYKMYESMLMACKDKSIIFISHRLSSAVLADRIYMLEDGQIVEAGSHAELMELNGKYARMFQCQAESYA